MKVAVKGGRGVGGFEGKRTGRHLAMLENLSDTVTMATGSRALAKAYAHTGGGALEACWKRAGPERRPGGVREVTSEYMIGG